MICVHIFWWEHCFCGKFASEVDDEEPGSGSAFAESEEQSEVDIDLQNNTNARKRKIRAPVWDVAVKTESGANCRFCQKSWVIKDGSTSNIKRHAETAHKDKPEVKKMMADYDDLKTEKEKKMKLKEQTQKTQKGLAQFGVWIYSEEGNESQRKRGRYPDG